MTEGGTVYDVSVGIETGNKKRSVGGSAVDAGLLDGPLLDLVFNLAVLAATQLAFLLLFDL